MLIIEHAFRIAEVGGRFLRALLAIIVEQSTHWSQMVSGFRTRADQCRAVMPITIPGANRSSPG
jgi:hypothetical protein